MMVATAAVAACMVGVAMGILAVWIGCRVFKDAEGPDDKVMGIFLLMVGLCIAVASAAAAAGVCMDGVDDAMNIRLVEGRADS